MKDQTNAVNTIYLTRTAFKKFMFLSAREHREAANSNIWERVIIINNIIMLQLLTNFNFKYIRLTFNIDI